MKAIETVLGEAAVEIGLLAILIAVLVAGCGPEFDDPTMAVLKKPEIISVVLEPPEAAPGETVIASFLMADERGVIDGRANLWLPGTGGDDPAALVEQLAWLGIELSELAEPTLELTVGPAALYQLDADGFGAQLLTLFAAAGDDPSPTTAVEQLLGIAAEAVVDGRMKTAVRTLVVSGREDRNSNPEILGVFAGTEDAIGGPLQIARSDDADLAAARQLAADNPLVLRERSRIFFHVEAEDDDGQEALSYQWISTGGDFGGLRERVQQWRAPSYRDLEAGDVDQTGMDNVDPRTDPNLRPVFVIVRDDLAEHSLGQAFAELYVRIVPAE